MTDYTGTATTAGGASGTALTRAAARWFESRGLDLETVIRAGVHSTADGSAIVFPFVENGKIVNRKYRGREKKFWQDADATATWWNHDVLLEQPETVLVVEGEMDGLTAIECGFPHVISPPSGAPAKEGEIDDEAPGSKFHFIHRTWPLLKSVKRFIIATDNDGPGRVLAGELVRRFRPQRCAFVTYPEGCKDLNEVLMKHGKAEVVRVINGAKPYPVNGLYTYRDLPPEEPIKAVSTGWEALDKHFRPFAGEFIVETGFPGAGKSTWNAAFLTNLANLHGWHCTVASFEESPQRFAGRIKRSKAGGFWPHMPEIDNRKLDDWVNDHFTFISQIPGKDEDDMDLDRLLESAEAAILRHGTKLLLIDPWNELEHKRRYDETETDYIGRAIRTMKRFAKAFECAVLVTAHPTKVQDKRDPMLYDIAGSANWANKCDVGLILTREPDTTLLKIAVRKPRFGECTSHGDVHLNFEWQSGRYTDEFQSIAA